MEVNPRRPPLGPPSSGRLPGIEDRAPLKKMIHPIPLPEKRKNRRYKRGGIEAGLSGGPAKGRPPRRPSPQKGEGAYTARGTPPGPRRGPQSAHLTDSLEIPKLYFHTPLLRARVLYTRPHFLWAAPSRGLGRTRRGKGEKSVRFHVIILRPLNYLKNFWI